MDHKKCFEFWAKAGTNCGVCLRVCAFNKGHHKIQDMARFFIKNARWTDKFIARLDDALGYGKFKKPDDFWQDTRPPSKR